MLMSHFWKETTLALWYSVVGISALHIHHLGPFPDPKDLALAQIHYLRATELFRLDTLLITKENAIMVVSFAILISIFHFKVSLLTDKISPENVIEILETFFALRSTLMLVQTISGFLGAKCQARLLLAQPRRQDSQDDSAILQIEIVEAIIFLDHLKGDDQNHCMEALSLLRQCYQNFGPVPSSYSLVALQSINRISTLSF